MNSEAILTEFPEKGMGLETGKEIEIKNGLEMETGFQGKKIKSTRDIKTTVGRSMTKFIKGSTEIETELSVENGNIYLFM